MIALNGVSKHYGRRALLVDASFQLNPGEKVGLVGPNGSGKSTIFRMLVGEETPDDGEGLGPTKATIGYFRQDASEVEAIVARFGEVQGDYQQLGGYEIEARAREVLAGLGFHPDQVDADVGALSGGWRMRVSIAKVLIGEPEVLLLDEPTNHLDIE